MQRSTYSPSRKQHQLFLRQKQEWQNWAVHMFVQIAQNSVNIFHLCESSNTYQNHSLLPWISIQNAQNKEIKRNQLTTFSICTPQNTFLRITARICKYIELCIACNRKSTTQRRECSTDYWGTCMAQRDKGFVTFVLLLNRRLKWMERVWEECRDIIWASGDEAGKAKAQT